MELTDMLDMLLPLTPMDMLHMLDTPMLLDMLELMVPTTLARGLLMLSLKLRLMLSMVLMDILDMLDTLMPPMVLMVPTLTSDKKKLLNPNLHQEKSIYFPPQHQEKNGNEFSTSRSYSQPVTIFPVLLFGVCRENVRMLNAEINSILT